jgi:hypothetical protein
MAMEVIKLTAIYSTDIRHLFNSPKFMGASTTTNYFVGPDLEISNFYHKTFTETYLSDLNSYHAYGCIDDTGHVTTILGFYESSDDASWYWNHIRTVGNNADEIKLVLDRVIAHNEVKGRYKFYSMFPKKYANTYRRLAFSKYNSERYDYFDEFSVNEKHQCAFTLPWQILYNRTLVPVDTIVRCTFLKQQYRDELYNAGRL